MAAGGAALLSARLSTVATVGSGAITTPSIGAVLSAASAVGGAVSAISVLRKSSPEQEENEECLELPRSKAVALAVICGALVPMPLTITTPTAVKAAASVALPCRLYLPGAVGVAVFMEVAHRRWVKLNPQSVASLNEAAEASLQGDPTVVTTHIEEKSLFGNALVLINRHLSPFSETGGVGALYLGASVAATCLGVQVDLALSMWRKSFFDALQAHDMLALQGLITDFCIIAATSITVGVYSGYLTTMWELKWRDEMTTELQKSWLGHRGHDLMRIAKNGEIDNCDQRIAEDAAIFAARSRTLLCGSIDAVLRLATFGPLLLRTSPTPLVWQSILAMSVGSSMMAHFVGRPLASRNIAQQRAEANFRAGLLRARVRAEESASTGEAPDGGSLPHEAENPQVAALFDDVKAATWLAARSSLALSTFTSTYGVTGGLVPFLVLAPGYFRGDITLGAMFQLESVTGSLRDGLDFVLNFYPDYASWRAATERLLAMQVAANLLPPEVDDVESHPESAVLPSNPEDVEDEAPENEKSSGRESTQSDSPGGLSEVIAID
eukprot:gnl/MRDRNA2_/MRDRNA2_23786_c0_seq1.p1 gnl/MRDRNA2_/MRDRNA2_23786_c0~~gnl/MRDRNA2_/MRDRNA2_23786_c0_seq1.p1  ORF type:complete len:561 (+),score=120.08 gnl/MRDRNA2_/MRDRNA2_23786_c0_seq1:22-1683(+)